MLKQPESPITPLQIISAADMAAGPTFVTPRMWVGDYTTLHLYVLPILKPTVTDNGTTVQAFVNFYQTVQATSIVPGANAVSPISRQFAVGSTRIYRGLFGTPAAFDIVPSKLMVNLPIVAPWVDVSLYINNQANVDSAQYSVWLSNQASNQPMASNTFDITHPANIAGGADNGGGFGNTSGIFVPIGGTVITELMTQTVGTGYFAWGAAGYAAGVPNQAVPPGSIVVKIVDLNPDSPTHLDVDIVHEIFVYPRNAPTASGYISVPLTGYKQAIYIANLTAGIPPPQDMAVHWFVTPEFR